MLLSLNLEFWKGLFGVWEGEGEGEGEEEEGVVWEFGGFEVEGFKCLEGEGDAIVMLATHTFLGRTRSVGGRKNCVCERENMCVRADEWAICSLTNQSNSSTDVRSKSSVLSCRNVF